MVSVPFQTYLLARPFRHDTMENENRKWIKERADPITCQEQHRRNSCLLTRARIAERTTIIRFLRQWVSCIPCGCVMASTCSPWRNTSRRGKKGALSLLCIVRFHNNTKVAFPSLSLQSFQLVQHNNHEACELVPCSFGPTGQVSTPLQKNKMNCMKHCGEIIQFSKYNAEKKRKRKK